MSPSEVNERCKLGVVEVVSMAMRMLWTRNASSIAAALVVGRHVSLLFPQRNREMHNCVRGREACDEREGQCRREAVAVNGGL